MKNVDLKKYNADVQKQFINWIKETEDCNWTHHRNLKWYLSYGPSFDAVNDIPTFEEAIRNYKGLEERHVRKVRSTFQYWLESVFEK